MKLGGRKKIGDFDRTMATIALVTVEDPRQFGLATLDSRERIVGFEEKSQTRHGQGWINAGVYALSPDAVAMIPDGRPVSLEREIFPILARQGKMNAWKHAGFWYDIGKIPDYITANRELLQRAEFRETGSSTGMNMSSLQIREPSYVGKECVLEESSKLGPYTILSEKVEVRKGSEVRGTIVFEQTSIGEGCMVEDSLIGEGVTVGKGARIGRGSIIAGQVTIRDGATIEPGSTVLN